MGLVKMRSAGNTLPISSMARALSKAMSRASICRISSCERPAKYSVTAPPSVRIASIRSSSMAARRVPDVAMEYVTRRAAMLDDLIEAIRTEGGAVTEYFAGRSQEEIRQMLARLIAFDNARAML